jgi:hypothetical protein
MLKHLLLGALVASAVSCAAESDMPEHRKVRTRVDVPDVRMEPEGNDIQYMAYCNDEERALTDWVDSRSEAESKLSEYKSQHPDRLISILWRQKPGTQKLVPKYPRG